MTIDALDQFVLSESFQERVERLARELRLAIKFDRPSILLAVYRSEFVRAEAEYHLSEKLSELGQQVVIVRVNEDLSDIPALLTQFPLREQAVFFVSGLRWGGGKDGRDAYRALNIRREYFVEHRIRMVLWLTEAEARELVYYATDFWAFRHRVVEFIDRPVLRHVKEHVGSLAWQAWDDRTFREDTAAKIALREQLLAELPSGDETIAERAELLYTLGPLYAAQGEYEKAVAAQEEALKLAQALGDTRLQKEYYDGLGNIYYEVGRTDEAITAYQKALELDPKSAYPYIGLGNVYHILGRIDEAIAAYQKALELDPQLASSYSGLGRIYSNLGHTDEAIASFLRAIDLDANDATTYISLAICYRKLGRQAEYEAHIEKARPLITNENEYNRACFEAIQGNIEAALDLLEKAINIKPGRRELAGRDPDFEFIRDDPRFQALVGTSTGDRGQDG